MNLTFCIVLFLFCAENAFSNNSTLAADMGRPKIKLGLRGPPRSHGAAVRIRCGDRKCKSEVGVKNAGASLSVARARVGGGHASERPSEGLQNSAVLLSEA